MFTDSNELRNNTRIPVTIFAGRLPVSLQTKQLQMNEHERLAKMCLLVLYSVAFFTPYQTTLKFESESNEIVNVIQNAIWQLFFVFQSTVVFFAPELSKTASSWHTCTERTSLEMGRSGWKRTWYYCQSWWHSRSVSHRYCSL